jgi:flavin-dependent dehydrogenase
MESKAEFVIIGAGTAGAIAFYYLTQFAPKKTILLEKKPEDFRFHSAKIIVGHDWQYLHSEIDRTDPNIFIRDINSICDFSRTNEAQQFGTKEFGKPYGNVVDEQNFIIWHINKGVENGGRVFWGEEVSDVTINDSTAIISTKNNITQELQTISSEMVLLSTGSHTASIQHKLGFEIPYELNQIVATFYADPSDIDTCFPTDYFYHLHPNISGKGPFQMTKGSNFFNIIVVSDEPHEQMIETFMRVIKNYDIIQPLFKKVKNPPDTFDPNTIRRIHVWKHPISQFVHDKVMLLGETTGLVSDVYYEGFIGTFFSSKTASQILKKIYFSGKNYSKDNLMEYDRFIRAELMQNFHKSQNTQEFLYLEGNDRFVI